MRVSAPGICGTGINGILQGPLVTRSESVVPFYEPLQKAALELGSLLLP